MIKENNISAEAAERLIHKRIGALETLFLARIVEYDEVKNTATVEPLEKILTDSGYEAQSLLFEVPVLLPKVKDFYVRVPFEEGDVIMCACSKHALEDLDITGEPEINTLVNKKRFSKNDAVVIGGYLVEKEGALSSQDRGSFLLQNRKTGAKIVFQENGTVNVENGTSITITPAGAVTVNAPGNMTFTTPTLQVNGAISATGAISSDTDCISAGVSGKGHTHQYKEPEHAKPPIPTSAPQ